MKLSKKFLKNILNIAYLDEDLGKMVINFENNVEYNTMFEIINLVEYYDKLGRKDWYGKQSFEDNINYIKNHYTDNESKKLLDYFKKEIENE